MHTIPPAPRVRAQLFMSLVIAAITAPAHAQQASLNSVFEAVWQRHPQALAQPLRDEALIAQQRAARAWSPEPATVELGLKTDQWSRDQGQREREWGVALPVWLPGERARAGALANAERAAHDHEIAAARLALAAQVREAWWRLAQACIDEELAAVSVGHARQLATDVARRVKAGDLARADQHQADAALARTEAAREQAAAARAEAQAALHGLTGRPLDFKQPDTRPEPLPAAEFSPSHAGLQALAARAQVASRAAELATTRSRAHPELYLAASKERALAGDPWENRLVVGVRLPLGGAKQDAAIAHAKAEAAHAEAWRAVQHDELNAAWAAARTRVEAMRRSLAAALRRAELAGQTHSFFEKSFALGETDLPTRLRIEAEARTAEREAAAARIALNAAISALRQAAGLLPE